MKALSPKAPKITPEAFAYWALCSRETISLKALDLLRAQRPLPSHSFPGLSNVTSVEGLLAIKTDEVILKKKKGKSQEAALSHTREQKKLSDKTLFRVEWGRMSRSQPNGG